MKSHVQQFLEIIINLSLNFHTAHCCLSLSLELLYVMQSFERSNRASGWQ